MNAILRILENHYPHAVSGGEIASLLDLSEEKVDLVLEFLAKYALISYEDKEKKAVISADFSALE